MSNIQFREPENDPNEVQQVSMKDINGADINEMGLHVSLNDHSYYFDFEINHLTHEMKSQLYKQIQSIVYTYKELYKTLFGNTK
jgi:hypothetical protein